MALNPGSWCSRGVECCNRCGVEKLRSESGCVRPVGVG